MTRGATSHFSAASLSRLTSRSSGSRSRTASSATSTRRAHISSASWTRYRWEHVCLSGCARLRRSRTERACSAAPTDEILVCSAPTTPSRVRVLARESAASDAQSPISTTTARLDEHRRSARVIRDRAQGASACMARVLDEIGGPRPPAPLAVWTSGSASWIRRRNRVDRSPIVVADSIHIRHRRAVPEWTSTGSGRGLLLFAQSNSPGRCLVVAAFPRRRGMPGVWRAASDLGRRRTW